MTQFKKMKMRINNPDHSKAVQEWLFEQGYEWVNTCKHFNDVGADMLFTSTWQEGRIGFARIDEDCPGVAENYYQEHLGEEINVKHLDPHLYYTHNSKYVPAKTFREKPAQNTFDNMLTNLKHVQKAIEKADNKQQKRLQDRDRMISKINEMLPEGVQCVVKDVENSPSFDPQGIVVGSVWECRSEDIVDTTLGYHYKVKNIENDGSVGIEDDVDYNVFNRHSFLKHFKRIS